MCTISAHDCSHTLLPNALYPSAPAFRPYFGVYANSQPALGRNTRLWRKANTVICALPSLYPSLGTWSPSVSAPLIPSGPRLHEITFHVALVCGCHLWHNSNDHCHCHCIPDNELRSFYFSARFLDPIFPLVYALELWVCRGILRCRRIPLLTKHPAAIILIRSTGAPEEFVQLICVALILVLASHFSHQRFQLLSTIL